MSYYATVTIPKRAKTIHPSMRRAADLAGEGKHLWSWGEYWFHPFPPDEREQPPSRSDGASPTTIAAMLRRGFAQTVQERMRSKYRRIAPLEIKVLI